MTSSSVMRRRFFSGSTIRPLYISYMIMVPSSNAGDLIPSPTAMMIALNWFLRAFSGMMITPRLLAPRKGRIRSRLPIGVMVIFSPSLLRMLVLG